jgi:hypothetical protein
MGNSCAGTSGRTSGKLPSYLRAGLALGVLIGGATSAIAQDTDSDFLCDAQEKVLGTSKTAPDTDGDGFSDTEELARGSSPLLASDRPTSRPAVSVAMSAHADDTDGRLHAIIALHSADMTLRDTRLEVGFQVRRTVVYLPPDWLAPRVTTRVTTDASQRGLVHLIDLPISHSMVQSLGELTFFVRATVLGSNEPPSTTTVQLVWIQGTAVLRMKPLREPGTPAPSNEPPGSIYVPLPQMGGMPQGWTSGEICYQRTSPVGTQGAVITHEIVDADCLLGWEGFCPQTCVTSVGTVFSTVDPLGLLGG